MNEERERILTIYDFSEDKYYTINDFVVFLEAKVTDEYEEFLNHIYVSTKFQAELLAKMESLKEMGMIERIYKDDDGKNIKLEMVEDLMGDVEIFDVIRTLNNSLEEFNEFFDEKRLETLNVQVNEVWERFNDDNSELLNNNEL